MVGIAGMHFAQLEFGHMTANAILAGGFASLPGMFGGGLLSGFYMACEAVVVVAC